MLNFFGNLKKNKSQDKNFSKTLTQIQKETKKLNTSVQTKKLTARPRNQRPPTHVGYTKTYSIDEIPSTPDFPMDRKATSSLSDNSSAHLKKVFNEEIKCDFIEKIVLDETPVPNPTPEDFCSESDHLNALQIEKDNYFTSLNSLICTDKSTLVAVQEENKNVEEIKKSLQKESKKINLDAETLNAVQNKKSLISKTDKSPQIDDKNKKSFNIKPPMLPIRPHSPSPINSNKQFDLTIPEPSVDISRKNSHSVKKLEKENDTQILKNEKNQSNDSSLDQNKKIEIVSENLTVEQNVNAQRETKIIPSTVENRAQLNEKKIDTLDLSKSEIDPNVERKKLIEEEHQNIEILKPETCELPKIDTIEIPIEKTIPEPCLNASLSSTEDEETLDSI